MKLRLVRIAYLPECTIGELYGEDGTLICHTLEDVVREVDGVPVKQWKVPGETAIPSNPDGYPLVVTYSPRFQCDLPLVEEVEGFTGIRIHALNRASQSEGCIGVGHWDGKSQSITKSRAALAHLMEVIEGGICTLSIVNGGDYGKRTDCEDQGNGEAQGV